VSTKLVSSCGRWLGMAAQAFSGMPGPSALAMDENFTGSSFALAHEYKSNGTLFPTAADMSMANQSGHNRVLFENWKPATDMSWAKVAAGGADARIDAEAAYLKSTFNLPFFLTVWHEPENDVNPTAGSGMTVTDYQAMYRHVILRLRADGAAKFVSVMNYMGFGRWNSMLDGLYPGDDVVDWIAYDPYQTNNASGLAGHDFADMVNRSYQSSPGFYTWATTKHPAKPLMLAEWGGLYNPANPTGQADFFHSVTTEIGSFPALHALVYFDIDVKYHTIDGLGTTPNSGATSLAAWKTMVTAPAFDTPTFTYTNGTLTPTKK
jgi:beta-mannanase